MDTNINTSMIGRSIPKLESIHSATGQTVYLEDFKVPGMLYGKILRSKYPHAKISNIDISEALKLEGVEAIITAEDTPKIPFVGISSTKANKLPLCDKKVRYIGDEVAAVAAVDEKTAEQALTLIKVEYEELPAVFTVEEAMDPRAPKIYEDSDDNIASHFVRKFGDPDLAFKQADYVFEDVFTVPKVVSCAMQPHGCIASYDIGGHVTLWTGCQGITGFQRTLAKTMNLPMNKVKVINLAVGGAFGNKTHMLAIEPIAAFLSKKARKPVRIVNTRYEEFTTTRTRYAMKIKLKTAVSKEGKLLARDAVVITDNGAYNNKAEAITNLTCNRIGNLYRIPNIRTEAFIVYTNNQQSGALRGWGGPQAHFAIESQMDIIANKLGMDPVKLRLINANKTGDVTAWGWQITSCGLSECISTAAESLGLSEKKLPQTGPKYRGRGIASVVHTGAGSVGTHGAGNFEGVYLKINGDGSIHATVGFVEIGQGILTTYRQLIAEVLGVDMGKISISGNDSDMVPPTMGTWGSRGLYIGGNAIILAAQKAKTQLAKLAEEILDTNAEDGLVFADCKIHCENRPEVSVSLQEVVAYSMQNYGQQIVSEAVFNPDNVVAPDSETNYGNYCPVYSYGAQAVEVEVDIETGKVDVLSIVAAHDVGKAINPLLIEGQVHGGIQMGMGYGLFEEIISDNGLISNPNFHKYKMVNAVEMPKITTFLIETNEKNGPFGAKGVGEPVTIPTAPAIANAIYDAVGVRINSLPITPEKILRALNNK